MTVPKAIRQALGASDGGRITFRVEDGTVSIHATAEPHEDPDARQRFAAVAPDP